MIYDERELAVLKVHTKDIEKYLRENVLTRTRENICISFGKEVTRQKHGLPTKCKRFNLIIDKNSGVYGTENSMDILFDKPAWETSGTYVASYYNAYDYAEFMGSLVTEWNTIKSSILTELYEQRQHLDKIDHFVL